MKNISQLIYEDEYNEYFLERDIKISSICYDSRKCSHGSLFVAIPGEKFDGHDFIEKAVENGATAIICQKIPDNAQSLGVAIIKVDSSRKMLAKISHRWYDDPSKKMKIIGVTGTNGKTTITYLLRSIFEQNGEKCGISGTTGIILPEEIIKATHTTPESLELCGHLAYMRDKGIDTVVMEVSSHALVQHRVSEINFDAAVFTNLTHEHLDYHNSLEEYAKAKKKLFDMLPENGKAIVHDLSEESRLMIKDTIAKEKLTVGRRATSDIKIINEKMLTDRSEFDLVFYNKKLHISTPLIGKFNIENTALAASLGLIMNIESNNIKKGIKASHGAPGRMQRIALRNGAAGVVDYAHTPDALEKALQACREVLVASNSKGKLICVFGCGGDRDRLKRPKMGKIATGISDICIITNDNPRTEDPDDIFSDIIKGIKKSSDYEIITARKEAIQKAYELSAKSDLILIAGKGHETYQIIGNTKHHFDDFEEISRFAQ